MRLTDLKPIIKDFLLKMCDEWFDNMPIYRSLSKSLIEANQNKYDNYLKMFENENGDIDVEGIINGLNEAILEPIRLDLPFIPNRVLLITKNDLERLKAEISRYK